MLAALLSLTLADDFRVVAGPDPSAFTSAGAEITAQGDLLRATWTAKPQGQPWDINLHLTSTASISKGETVVLELEARSPERVQAGFYFEKNQPPHDKAVAINQVLTPEWSKIRMAGVAGEDLPSGGAQVAIHLNFGSGSLEIRNLTVKASATVRPSAIPMIGNLYGGKGKNDAWKKAAERRIEQIRKRDLTVTVLDFDGKPVRGANVQIRQTRHAFRFGTAVPAGRILEQSPDGEKYREILTRVFNTVVFENDLKWQRLGTPDDSQVIPAIAWLRKHQFDIRGHNLVWGSERWMPREAWALSNEDLWNAIVARTEERTARFQDDLYLWDVVNEAVTETGLWDRIGWNRFPEVFKLAKKSAPSLLTCYNDFDLFEESQTSETHIQRGKERIQALLAADAPLDVIGSQAHVRVPLTPIDRVLARMDEFAKFGKPMEITEFDVGVWNDDVHAEYTADYLTAAFSHPSVEGFLFWGFWQNSHWRAADGGAMWLSDWTPRKSALAVEDLIKRRWWTQFDAKTGATGQVKTRAFFGDYEVRVNGVVQRFALTKAPTDGRVTVRLPR